MSRRSSQARRAWRLAGARDRRDVPVVAGAVGLAALWSPERRADAFPTITVNPATDPDPQEGTPVVTLPATR
jgi:hypothetical protein